MRLHWATEDAPRTGAPKLALTLENMDKIHNIDLAGMQVKVRELAETVSILIDQVHFISHHEKNCAHDEDHVCSLKSRNEIASLANLLN